MQEKILKNHFMLIHLSSDLGEIDIEEREAPKGDYSCKLNNCNAFSSK